MKTLLFVLSVFCFQQVFLKSLNTKVLKSNVTYEPPKKSFTVGEINLYLNGSVTEVSNGDRSQFCNILGDTSINGSKKRRFGTILLKKGLNLICITGENTFNENFGLLATIKIEETFINTGKGWKCNGSPAAKLGFNSNEIDNQFGQRKEIADEAEWIWDELNSSSVKCCVKIRLGKK